MMKNLFCFNEVLTFSYCNFLFSKTGAPGPPGKRGKRGKKGDPGDGGTPVSFSFKIHNRKLFYRFILQIEFTDFAQLRWYLKVVETSWIDWKEKKKKIF